MDEPLPQHVVNGGGTNGNGNGNGNTTATTIQNSNPSVAPVGAEKRPLKVWYDEQHTVWYRDCYWAHKGYVQSRKAYVKAINRLHDRDKMGYNGAKLFLWCEGCREDKVKFEHARRTGNARESPPRLRG